MIDENTGEEPKCVICGSIDECSHLLASIDHTFLECDSGALYDQDIEFRLEIEAVFLKNLMSGTKTKWENNELEELWGQAQTDFNNEGKDLMLDGYIFYRFLCGLLENAGAINHPGSIAVYGGPGMSSAITLLYAEQPDRIIAKAMKNLKSTLGQ